AGTGGRGPARCRPRRRRRRRHDGGHPRRADRAAVLAPGAGDLADPPPPRAGQRRIASHTRDGVSGMSAWRTPNGARASITAFTIAGGDPTVADSPIPLAPSGWCGDGVTVWPVSQSGTSLAVGIR